MAYSLLDSYGRHWRMQGRADTTLATYMNSLRLFIRDVLDGDEQALVDADRVMLEMCVEHRLETVSANSASNDVRAFRSFFSWAEEEDEIDVSPAKRLKHPKVDEPPVRVATDDDLARLLAVCGRDKLGRRDAAMVALLVYAGLRRGELPALDLEHLNLEGGRLTIPKTKTGRPRTVPLHPEVVARLDRYLRHRGDRPGPLFAPHRGQRLKSNGVGQMIERRATAAGVDVRAHAFRRRFATEHLRRGGGEVALQALGGWSSKTMIASYTRMDREELAGRGVPAGVVVTAKDSHVERSPETTSMNAQDGLHDGVSSDARHAGEGRRTPSVPASHRAAERALRGRCGALPGARGVRRSLHDEAQPCHPGHALSSLRSGWEVRDDHHGHGLGAERRAGWVLALEQARRSQGWDQVSIISTRMVGANSYEVRLFVSRESGVPV